jgi:cytoskeletal protein CcmA (bactofilin family)
MRRLILIGLVLIGVVFAAPSVSMAADIRQGAAPTVAADETIDGDLIALGQSVTIAGHVTGDVYSGAQTVVVTGTVDGDLLAAAQQVTVQGIVGGDVRASGATVTVNGTVRRNVTGFGQRVVIGPNGRVDGSVVAAGERIEALGQVGRDVTVGANILKLGGPVGGDVHGSVERLEVDPAARIAGALEYRAEQEAMLPDGTVAGPVTYTPVDRQAREADLLNGLLEPFGLIWLAGTAVLGAIALLVFPRAAAHAVWIGRCAPLQTFGAGLAMLVALPIVAALFAGTLIGLPIAVALLAMFVLAVVLAWPAAGLFVGSLIGRALPRGPRLRGFGALLLGLIVLHLLTHVPYVGGVIGLLSLMLGLGLLVQLVWRARARPLRRVLEPDAPAARAVAA